MASRQPSDDDLVARVLAGEKDAFAVLVERYTAYVYGVVRRFATTDPAIDHEDVAQEVFVRAYARLATYVPNGQFGAWLARIAANWCIDRQRRRRFVTTMPDPSPLRAEPAPGPEALLLRRELGDALGDALAALTPHQRGAVLLCCGQGRGHAEAGAVLGVPTTTVKMRVWAGRRRLRALLAGV